MRNLSIEDVKTIYDTLTYYQMLSKVAELSAEMKILCWGIVVVLDAHKTDFESNEYEDLINLARRLYESKQPILS